MIEALQNLPQLFHALSVVSFYIVTRIILPAVVIGALIWYRYEVLLALLGVVSVFVRVIDRIIFMPINKLFGIIGRIAQGMKRMKRLMPLLLCWVVLEVIIWVTTVMDPHASGVAFLTGNFLLAVVLLLIIAIDASERAMENSQK